MHSLFQSLKDSKRRIAQKVKAATGLSTLSSDDDFETLYCQYEEVVKSLMRLIDHSKTFEKNMERWCETNLQLSEKMECAVSNSQIVDAADVVEYNQTIVDLHACYRSEFDYVLKSISHFIQSRIVNRLEQFIKEGTHNVDVLYKQRKNIMLDYDSHLGKVTMYESKNEEDQVKRFQMKADHDKVMLDSFSNYLYKRLSEFISVGSKLLITEMATLVTCEMYLVKQQYDSLAEIGNNIGEETISPIVSDLDGIYEEVVKNIDRLSYTPPPIHMTSYPESEYPVMLSFNDYIKTLKVDPKTTSNKSEGESATETLKDDDFGDLHIGMKVQAAYNCKGDEEGELGFKKGDVIIVTHFFEGGWWEGKCNGVIGIFPSNYVKPCK